MTDETPADLNDEPCSGPSIYTGIVLIERDGCSVEIDPAGKTVRVKGDWDEAAKMFWDVVQCFAPGNK